MTADTTAVLKVAGSPGGIERVDDRARWSALFETVTGSADGMSVISRIASRAVLLAKEATTGLGPLYLIRP